MPSAFDECCEELKGAGVDKSTACRACRIAYYDAFSMSPEAADSHGLNPGGSITSRAWDSIAELEGPAPDGFLGLESDLAAALKEPVKLEAYDWKSDAAEEAPRSIFREVRLLAPGRYIDAKGKPFEVTDADLKQYAANFQPSNNPPILLDHEITARGLQGYIRAIRYQAGYDESSSELLSLWEFLGEEACQKVEDGLWKRVSGLFGRSEPKKVYEGSVVVFGAYDRGRGDRAEILKQRGAMSMPNPPNENPTGTPATAPAQAGSPPAPASAPPAAAPAPVTPPAPAPAAAAQDSEVAQLKSQVANFEAKFAAMRAREDKADFALLKAEGFAAPAGEEAEVAFMGLLPEETKAAWLKLRRTYPKVWDPQRQTEPENPKKPGEGAALNGVLSQDQVLAGLQAASGMPTPPATK